MGQEFGSGLAGWLHFGCFMRLLSRCCWGLVVTGRLDWDRGSAVRLAPLLRSRQEAPLLSWECPYGAAASVPGMWSQRGKGRKAAVPLRVLMRDSESHTVVLLMTQTSLITGRGSAGGGVTGNPFKESAAVMKLELGVLSRRHFSILTLGQAAK